MAAPAVMRGSGAHTDGRIDPSRRGSFAFEAKQTAARKSEPSGLALPLASCASFAA
jgi:hypothetical protein